MDLQSSRNLLACPIASASETVRVYVVHLAAEKYAKLLIGTRLMPRCRRWEAGCATSSSQCESHEFVYLYDHGTHAPARAPDTTLMGGSRNTPFKAAGQAVRWLVRLATRCAAAQVCMHTGLVPGSFRLLALDCNTADQARL